MGFLNKFFSGLGFVEEDDIVKKETSTNEIQEDRYNKFNLHNNERQPEPTPVYASNTVSLNNLIIYAPKNHGEVQKLVDALCQNEACIVNLGGIAEKDCDRILDFLSGAVYALNGSIKRLQGDLFVLTPKGIEIKNA